MSKEDRTRRGDRLFEVVEILRHATGPMSVQSIGSELGVTKRRVYRDVAALIGQAVPINGEAGVGYVLEPGFHTPPLMLTSDEIEEAMLWLLWVRTSGEPELGLAAEKLIAKLEPVAPDTYRASFLEQVVSLAPVDQPDDEPQAPLASREPCPECGGTLDILKAFRRGQTPRTRAPPRKQAA